MKTQNTIILLLLAILLFESCTEVWDVNIELKNKVKEVAEKYGFQAEPLNPLSFEVSEGIHLKSSELEVFFNYLQKGKLDREEINYSELSEIFERNNISLSNSPLSNLQALEKSIENNSNVRILCFQNSYLKKIQVPNMPLPGDTDLNGVEITFGVGNGILNTSNFGMYGFYPLMSVVNTAVNPSLSNNNYVFDVSYTVAFTFFVDGAPFISYDNVALKVRIDACTGDVTWFYAVP
jgi:hypothetical protein